MVGVVSVLLTNLYIDWLSEWVTDWLISWLWGRAHTYVPTHAWQHQAELSHWPVVIVLMAFTSQQLPRILYVILPSILPNRGYTVTILPPGVHNSWGEKALPGHRAISVLVSIRLGLWMCGPWGCILHLGQSNNQQTCSGLNEHLILFQVIVLEISRMLAKYFPEEII